MAARSPAELLPVEFDSLEVEHVEQIVADAGDPGENLFLEWKSDLSHDHIAKAATAFANALGGLLIGGVDNSKNVVGIPLPSGETQLWVKEILRSRVLPLPPFRARSLEVGDGRALVLVLVEESSTTPHVLAKRGAIYVRNQGSSDPVPIGDQATLFELVRRGREARGDAELTAAHLAVRVEPSWSDDVLLYSMALVPTGATRDPVAELHRLGSSDVNQRVGPAVHIFEEDGDGQTTFLPPRWSRDEAHFERRFRRRSAGDFPPAIREGVSVFSDCSVHLYRLAAASNEFEPFVEPRGKRPLHVDDDPNAIVPWFTKALDHGRDLVFSLGGHGDLRVDVRIASGGRKIFDSPTTAIDSRYPLGLAYWTFLFEDEGLVDQFRYDVLRSLGIWKP